MGRPKVSVLRRALRNAKSRISTGTSGVGRKEASIVGSRAKAMPRNLSAIAIRYCACEASDSSTDRLRRKGVFAKGGTEIEEPKGRDPMQEAAIEG